MVRVPLSGTERERGERLGRLLRAARGERGMAEVAFAAGISGETLRKIETGHTPTPAFFTVAALARVLDLSLDSLAEALDGQWERPRRRAMDRVERLDQVVPQLADRQDEPRPVRDSLVRAEKRRGLRAPDTLG